MQQPNSKTKILNPTPENIQVAVEALISGDVIGLPTETVYGLAGSALNDEAIAKIFFYKSRPSFDPLIVHVAETLKSCKALAHSELINLAVMAPAQIKTCDKLMELFWPGPLTLIFPKHARISDLVTSSLDTVGLRSPAHPVAQEILKKSSLPLAAPSANQFGRISPTKATHVLSELGAHLNYCLEGGECAVGLESTICSVAASGHVTVLRPGGVPREALEKALGSLFQGVHSELGLPSVAAHAPMAPGLLESHYAPRKTMFRLEGEVTDELIKQTKEKLIHRSLLPKKIDVLTPFILPREIRLRFTNTFQDVTFHSLADHEENSLQGAHTLFAKLRELDQNDSELIFCSLPQSPKGLWPAIKDRLTRASQILK